MSAPEHDSHARLTQAVERLGKEIGALKRTTAKHAEALSRAVRQLGDNLAALNGLASLGALEDDVAPDDLGDLAQLGNLLGDEDADAPGARDALDTPDFLAAPELFPAPAPAPRAPAPHPEPPDARP